MGKIKTTNMSNNTKIINTIFILFFVMTSYYSTNLRKSQKSLGSPKFDIFNLDKMAEKLENHKKHAHNHNTEENANKMLKDEIEKAKQESSHEGIKKSFKKEMQKAQDAINNAQEQEHENSIEDTIIFAQEQENENSSDKNDGRKKEKFDILFRNHTKVKQEDKRRFFSNIMIQKDSNTTSKKSGDNDIKGNMFDLLFRNHTKVKQEKRRRFFSKMLNFIQEEMSSTDEDPEITKIKAMIKNSNNKNDDELTKVKQSLKKNQKNNDEIQKIKNLINPKKSKPVKKVEPTVGKSNKVQVEDKVESPKKINKEKVKEKLNKTDVEFHKDENKIEKSVQKKEKKIRNAVQKYENNAIEAKQKIENKIKQRFNKTETEERFNRPEFRHRFNRTEIRHRFNRTEIRHRFNNITEIKEDIVKEKLKNKIKSSIEKNDEIEKVPAEIREEETINNHIKDFAAKALQNASDRLEKEINAELQKESAEDTMEKVRALFNLKNQNFAEDFQKAANELKAEISADVLDRADKQDVVEKARAVKILENIENSSLEEKGETAETLKKIVFQMMRGKRTMNENAKEVLARAFDKMNNLKRQEIEKNNAAEKLREAVERDAEEKEKSFDSLRNAKEEAKTAIEEIAEEKEVMKNVQRRRNLRRQ